MLAARQRELVEDGLVKRTVFTEVQPRVEQELTPSDGPLSWCCSGLRD
jgi:DNA-binding HxlR family transcriptional regulator